MMKKILIAIVRPVCMITTAMVWMVMHMAVYHYVAESTVLSTYVMIVLSIAFPISALSGAGYIFYRWLKEFTK